MAENSIVPGLIVRKLAPGIIVWLPVVLIFSTLAFVLFSEGIRILFHASVDDVGVVFSWWLAIAGIILAMWLGGCIGYALAVPVPQIERRAKERRTRS